MAKIITTRGIVYIDQTYHEYGPVPLTKDTIYVRDSSGFVLPALPELKQSQYLTYSVALGVYILNTLYKDTDLYLHTHCYGLGLYPYQACKREYGAFHNMAAFTKSTKQYLQTQNYPTHVLTQYCKYTFGVEFETSMGAIPEEECYNKGLIPLRDGSISGVEYSTVVLKGNDGFNLLNEQMNLLNTYTKFNKECAVHIHFGGFPVEPQAILMLNNLCSMLGRDLLDLCPTYSFNTELYKNNRKSYCKPLDYYDNFNDLYRSLTGVNYLGDLYQPHPNDPDKTRKWEIHSRYKMCNLVNMVCYDSPKTIEFRFLRPTHNVQILYLWIYIFNAILEFAKKCTTFTEKQLHIVLGTCTLSAVLQDVYPNAIAKLLLDDCMKLKCIRKLQKANGDMCGRDVEFENDFQLSAGLQFIPEVNFSKNGKQKN